MVLDKLGSALKSSLSKIARSVFIDEKLVNELVRDIQRALLQADVNVQLVLKLTNDIKKKFLENKQPSSLTNKEFLVKIVYDELVKFLGGKKSEIVVDKTKKPFKVMLLGLFGSGKTTTIGKLVKYYQNRGYKVAALGLDVHRPAAPEQLQQVCDKVGVKCFVKPGENSPVKVYQEFEDKYKDYDILFIDTAGRDALSQDLIKEIEELNNYIKPDERLLVISADIGQAAQKQAQQFHDSCNITGVIITKMDGTAKGGGALTACAVTSAPVKFIGVGEKVDDIEKFSPEGFVGRLLGMGDIETLLDKASEAMSQEQAADLSKKMLQGEFNFIDLYEQMKAMSKMGSLSKLIDFIPGMGNLNIPKEMISGQEHKVELWKHIMQSMTKEELQTPDVLDSSRIERIAKGAGVEPKDVRGLLKQYRLAKKMVKQMKNLGSEQDLNKLLKKFKGKMPKKFF